MQPNKSDTKLNENNKIPDPDGEKSDAANGLALETINVSQISSVVEFVKPLEELLVSDIAPTTTKQRFSPLWRQVLASSGPIMATIAAGMTSGYSAVLLPQLAHPNSTIQITQNEASWIASMAALPMSLGCIIAGFLMEHYGRRITLMILCVPFVLGWVLISMANSIPLILAGRFISGLCVGLLGPPTSVYIGETSGPKYRGFLLAAVSLAIAVGILIAHVLGTFLHWQLAAATCSVFPFMCYILITTVPESPSWLASKGKMKEAEAAFRWLRGCDQDALTELELMLQKQAAANSAKPINGGLKETWNKLLDNIKRPEFVKPLLIIFAFFFTTQFSGVNAVAFYSVTIMKDTVGSGLDEYLAMTIIDVVRVIMSVVACVLTRRFGRRPLAITSGIGTAFSLLGLALFLYLASKDSSYLSMSWLPMTFLMGYICFVSIGIVPLPWVMTGEVFPVAVRGLGSGASSSFAFLAFFIVVKTGPAMFDNLGPDGTFFTYGSIALAGTIVLCLFLPETKDRTLQEIEEQFIGNTKNDSKVV